MTWLLPCAAVQQLLLGLTKLGVEMRVWETLETKVGSAPGKCNIYPCSQGHTWALDTLQGQHLQGTGTITVCVPPIPTPISQMYFFMASS